MPRREFELSQELFKKQILWADAVPMTVLAVEVDHRYGVLRIIMEDPAAPPLREGEKPRVESLD